MGQATTSLLQQQRTSQATTSLLQQQRTSRGRGRNRDAKHSGRQDCRANWCSRCRYGKTSSKGVSVRWEPNIESIGVRLQRFDCVLCVYTFECVVILDFFCCSIV